LHVTPEDKTALKIDIDKLSEEELIDLNHRIVERLRFLNQMRALADAGLQDRRPCHFSTGRPSTSGWDANPV